MVKYIQNTVVEVLTPGAPAYDGFTETFFPTVEDHRDRFVTSAEDLAERSPLELSRALGQTPGVRKQNPAAKNSYPEMKLRPKPRQPKSRPGGTQRLRRK